ncbi:hypothetical protein AAKU64_004236 [Undibacterium sp. GrIS 1.8]
MTQATLLILTIAMSTISGTTVFLLHRHCDPNKHPALTDTPSHTPPIQSHLNKGDPSSPDSPSPSPLQPPSPLLFQLLQCW